MSIKRPGACPRFPPGTPRPSRRAPACRRTWCSRRAAGWVRIETRRRARRKQLRRRDRSTVSVVRPRKSNFTSPAGSTHFRLNWVTGTGIADRDKRHQLGERPIADDDAGGVGGGVTGEPFKLCARCRRTRRTAVSALRARLQQRLILDGGVEVSPEWADCSAPACRGCRPAHTASAARGRRRAARRAPATCRR